MQFSRFCLTGLHLEASQLAENLTTHCRVSLGPDEVEHSSSDANRQRLGVGSCEIPHRNQPVGDRQCRLISCSEKFVHLEGAHRVPATWILGQGLTQFLLQVPGDLWADRGSDTLHVDFMADEVADGTPCSVAIDKPAIDQQLHRLSQSLLGDLTGTDQQRRLNRPT